MQKEPEALGHLPVRSRQRLAGVVEERLVAIRSNRSWLLQANPGSVRASGAHPGAGYSGICSQFGAALPQCGICVLDWKRLWLASCWKQTNTLTNTLTNTSWQGQACNQRELCALVGWAQQVPSWHASNYPLHLFTWPVCVLCRMTDNLACMAENASCSGHQRPTRLPNLFTPRAGLQAKVTLLWVVDSKGPAR